MNMIKNICGESNVNLRSSFYVKMPTNYLIKSRMLSNSEIEIALQKADKKINRIIDIVNDRKVYFEKDSRLYSIITKANQYQKPIWTGKCQACLKCINICPQEAIQYGHITEGKKRYFNPKIKISEIA